MATCRDNHRKAIVPVHPISNGSSPKMARMRCGTSLRRTGYDPLSKAATNTQVVGSFNFDTRSGGKVISETLKY